MNDPRSQVVASFSPSVEAFFDWMDGFETRVPLDELKARLETLDITLDDVRDFVRFSDERYQRNLMHAGSGYHVLILCWKNGQRSPIHDHRGSSCGVRVIRGVATETSFKHSANGLVYAVASCELPENGVCGSQDTDMHQVSNLQPGDADLVTLHVYSPPLLVMGTYSLTDAHVEDFIDPVFEFTAGAGI